MNLVFLHPSTSDSFEADVEPACTGQIAIEGLIEAGFVARPTRATFDLVNSRTRSAIQPNATFGEAGVVPGDRVNLFLRGAGA